MRPSDAKRLERILINLRDALVVTYKVYIGDPEGQATEEILTELYELLADYKRGENFAKTTSS